MASMNRQLSTLVDMKSPQNVWMMPKNSNSGATVDGKGTWAWHVWHCG